MAATDALAIRDWIIQWFAKRGRQLPVAGALADIDFLETGLLDSMSLIDLIIDIESKFKIRLGSDTMKDPRFSKLSGLASIIDEESAQ